MVSFLHSNLLRSLALFGTAFLSGCNGLFFYPQRTLVRTPADVGVAFERVELNSPDKATLVGWFLPTKMPARGTILFLHGNAENISTHLAAVHWLPDEGYQVFLLDYQGYGESGGSASIENSISDIGRAIEYLKTRPDVDSSRFFLLGQSLGASFALYVAAQSEFSTTFQAVVADSPFASYRQIAREKLATVWVGYALQWPLGFLISDAYSPNKIMLNICVPVLFLSGTNDSIVPAEHSASLCAQLKDACQNWVVEGAQHGEILALPEYRKRLVRYLDVVNR